MDRLVDASGLISGLMADRFAAYEGCSVLSASEFVGDAGDIHSHLAADTVSRFRTSSTVQWRGFAELVKGALLKQKF